MPVPPAFPGPDALGRSLVVLPGSPVPAPFADCPRIRIDADAPDADARRFLARRWNTRQRVVIELTGRALDVDMAESCNAPVWELDPAFDFAHERWRVLVWANAYDARDGTPRWPATAVARRVAAANGVPVRTSGRADLELADGTAVWVDDGPADAVALAGPARRLPRASLAIGRWHLPATGPTAIDPGLDVEQREVVAHGAGPIRVVAPAGSGKTRVLVARTSRLVSAHAVLPERITAIAYNTRAAAELRHRIQHPDVRVRTFHALAQSILAVGGVRSRIDLPRSRQLLADTLPPPARDVHRTRDAAVDAYLAAATQIRLGLRPPEQVADERRDVPDLARVFTRYRSGLAAAGMLDFDEQVVQAIELLLRSPTLRHRVRHHTAQLLVDEMQDCTPAFALLVKLLTGPAQQCVLVGDDDQTIYRHAGADPTWLQHPGSWLDTPRTVTLRVNHRCPGDVVDAAERLLARVADRTPRSTRAATGRRDGLHVHHIAPSQRATAMLTAVHRASSPDEVAVLARTNATLLVAQVALAAASIPRTTGVSPGLLQQPAFATVLAYLRIAIEPTRIRRADLAAVLRRPRRKLAAAVLPKVAATTSRRRLGLLTRTLDRDHRPAFRRLLD
ncbi:MAG: ATP-dependent helicase, partial [Nitriliruptoraceae bacterium]